MRDRLAKSGGNTTAVLIVIRHFHPTVGGAEVQAHRLAKALIEQGIAVTVVTGRYYRLSGYEEIDNVPVRRLPIGLYLPVIHEIFWLLSLTWYLFRQRDNYHIVHCFQTQLATMVSALVARPLGKPVVTRTAGAAGTGDVGKLMTVPGGKTFLKVIGKRVDAAVVLSDELRRELTQAGFPDHTIHQIPNGIAVHASRPQEAQVSLDSKPTVLFVGRLAPVKDIPTLLRAWQNVANLHPNANVILVGNGPLRQELEAEVAARGLGNNVQFAGKAVPAQVVEYLQNGDIFVLPSLSEGLSNALLEAMASGLPIVASRVSGTIDLIRDGENGLLFEVGDADMLGRHLNRLLSDGELRANLGAKALSTVRACCEMEVIASRYASLYRQLLDSKEEVPSEPVTDAS